MPLLENLLARCLSRSGALWKVVLSGPFHFSWGLPLRRSRLGPPHCCCFFCWLLAWLMDTFQDLALSSVVIFSVSSGRPPRHRVVPGSGKVGKSRGGGCRTAGGIAGFGRSHPPEALLGIGMLLLRIRARGDKGRCPAVMPENIRDLLSLCGRRRATHILTAVMRTVLRERRFLQVTSFAIAE